MPKGVFRLIAMNTMNSKITYKVNVKTRSNTISLWVMQMSRCESHDKASIASSLEVEKFDFLGDIT